MVQALINPKMVAWARKRIQLTPEGLAGKLPVSIDKIKAWEDEDKREYPSFNQAIILSNKLHVPLGYLYLAEPPVENVPLPDLRTVANRPLENPSVDFIDVLYDAYRKQDWFRNYLVGEHVSELEFAGKFTVDDDPKSIASDIRETLRINDDLRQLSSTWNQFFTALVRRAEDSRILVLRNSVVFNNTYRKLDVNEFRGFVIFDKIAPIIFINTRDYQTAQIFTLIHEIAHIWIGVGGISNLDFKLKDEQQRVKVDSVCDSIASEVLVPENQFFSRWNDSRPVDDNISRLALNFKVSSFVILRRAYNLDKISKEIFMDNYHDLLSKIRPKPKEPGGDFYAMLKARNSYTLTATLMAGLLNGTVTANEASLLLNVRSTSLKGIESSF
jgi:Zn-dependent peptidase ImmA (M78 family)